MKFLWLRVWRFLLGLRRCPTSVTVTGVLQPVTVTVTPSAGTVSIIILNGVAQGAGPVTAPPNSTLRFSLTVPAVLGTKNTATIAIGDDSYSLVGGLCGQHSKQPPRIFVTSTVAYPNYGGLAGADSYCNARAAASSLPLSSQMERH
jgi:hypothetical protein